MLALYLRELRLATRAGGGALTGVLFFLAVVATIPFALGPDLTTVRNAGREKLLQNILDPSREVQPNFLVYQIDTADGESIVGVITSDTPAGLVLRQAYGKETTIQRDKIKKMSTDGRSLMPDGLEAGLAPQDIADLLTFIETFGK